MITKFLVRKKKTLISKKIFFISGVNGVGKSSIIPYLSLLLPTDSYIVCDFDERGIPAKADTEWRISETSYWVSRGIDLAKDNKNLVVCGFVKLTDFPAIKSPEIIKILLDARPEIIRQRLINRYSQSGIFDKSQKVIGKPIDVFIEGNIYILNQMKESFEELNYPIIDTSKLKPAEVANKIADIILKQPVKKLCKQTINYFYGTKTIAK
jgi:energy-coupling factor transporter ATP-binding protein EcfA2